MVFIDSLDVHSPYIPYIPYVSYSSVFPVRKRDGDPWNLPCSQLLSWACQANRFDKFQRSLGYKKWQILWQVLGTFSEMALAQRPVVWRRKSQWINGTYLQIKNHQQSSTFTFESFMIPAACFCLASPSRLLRPRWGPWPKTLKSSLKASLVGPMCGTIASPCNSQNLKDLKAELTLVWPNCH